jgi:uncharacterized protein YkwD
MRAYLLAVVSLCLSLTAAHAKSDCALMQKLAQEHANSMAARNMMDHAGFESRAARGAKAENAAYGVKTKAEAMAMWMASPPHAANMMLPGCKAVASAVSRSGVHYWAMEIAKTSIPRHKQVAVH